MQGIYTYNLEANHVPREYTVAAIQLSSSSSSSSSNFSLLSFSWEIFTYPGI
jgi:hypothetical protein